MISLDLHAAQIQGFFGPHTPCENLEGQLLFVQALMNDNIIDDLSNIMVVSPDAGGVYRAKTFSEIFNYYNDTEAGLSIIVKQRQKANQIAAMNLVGNVQGYDCLIIDDIIDTAV